ncbi:hsp70-Hsp90 organizing protein-like isoform X2 [Thalassophryne amazonica]|uniref:hsp70-Hsp90 organizing protein-like isoform X2 n=1 Tax=Thalassophryne amazonica TaxID=390379 RepID=UPI001470B4F3|nr:hsp70-Hsp90 organizing protein-like isoform X2 [Thalassophryne amazonica]
MVALMKFTRDICRLLGLGSGPAVQQEQEPMDYGAACPDLSQDSTLSQDAVNGEEALSEQEKIRRRAERRRAKRTRRRKRKKQEQVKQSESIEQDDDDEDGGAESELEESDLEAEAVGDNEELVLKEENKETKPAGSCKYTNNLDMNSSGIKGYQKSHSSSTEETNGSDTVTKKSASLTEKGIKLVQEGQYAQAVSMFTEAIKYDPKDYRFFGNRSYCYICLEQYPQALADAERSIQMAPDWPKGHFRKGSALMGMKRYSEAEKAMEQVLKLDKDCEEALNDLFNCKVLQLMELGFEEVQSVLLLEKFSSVQAVLSSCSDFSRAGSQDLSVLQPGSPCPSLWVGNVTTELTEKHLWDLFKMYGEIESIRVLHERFCAFVNFKNANMAAHAMEKLNGYCIENTRLVVRYPDRRTQRVLPLKTCLPVTQQAGPAAGPRRRGPVNGDECYFWRTTGCHFGDKCRYKHIPEQKGKDRKPWQP